MKNYIKRLPNERATLVEMIFGSHLYGLSGPNSDKDFKQVFMPSMQSIFLDGPEQSQTFSTGSNFSKNTADDVDMEKFSFDKFMTLATKGEMIAFDMLHAPESAWTVDADIVWTKLVENRDMFYSKNMKAYLGYVRKQAAKYSCKGSKLNVLENILDIMRASCGVIMGDVWATLPVTEYSAFETHDGANGQKYEYYVVVGKKFQNNTKLNLTIESLQKAYDGYGARAKLAQQNEGLDWKAISHAFRAGFQLRTLFREGTFTFPFVGLEREFLLAVKAGQEDWNRLSVQLDELFEELQKLSAKSSFPEHPDLKRIEDFRLQTYSDFFGIALR